MKPKSPSSAGFRFFREADYLDRAEALVEDLERALGCGYRVVLVDASRRVVLTGDPKQRGCPWRGLSGWFCASARQALDGNKAVARHPEARVILEPFVEDLDLLLLEEV